MFFDISPWSRLIKYGQSNSIILLVISFLIILSNLDLQITKYLLDIKKIIDEIIYKTRNIKGPFANLIFKLLQKNKKDFKVLIGKVKTTIEIKNNHNFQLV